MADGIEFESDLEDFDFDEFDEGDLGPQEIQDWDEDDWEVDCDFLEEIDKAGEADLEGFRCSMCEKSYKTNGWLLRHVRTKQGSNTQETSPTTASSQVNPDRLRDTRLSKSEAERCALELLDGCLSEAITFKPFCVKVKNPTRGNKAKNLAVSLREKIKENIVGSFATECVRMLWKSVTAGDKCKTLSSNREEMMKSFHNFRTSQELKDRWDEIIRLLELQNHDGLLFQFIIDRMFRNLIVKREEQAIIEKRNVIETSPDCEVKLDTLEENALRYVAGYIPLAVRRRVDNSNSRNKQAILACIDKWKSKENGNTRNTQTFLEYTKKWTEAINRGGLFAVNDSFYIFIRRIENVVRMFFTNEFLCNYDGGSIKSSLMKKLVSNKLILSGWADLVIGQDFPDDLSSVLFNRILEHYVNIRARAFVVAWLQVQKNKKRLSHAKKGEKGLRKGLMRNSEEKI